MMTAPLTVLLAEDDADLRALLRTLLDRDAAFDCVAEAADGRRTVELAQRLQPDVVLLNLRMPVLDGLRAIPLLREAGSARIVAHSTSDEMLQEARRLGVDGWHLKSGNWHALRAALLERPAS